MFARIAAIMGGQSALTQLEEETRAHHDAADAPWLELLLRDVTLFDLFRLPDGRRSLAWRLTYQADDRTLRDDEVNAVNERAAERVAQQFTISRRGA